MFTLFMSMLSYYYYLDSRVSPDLLGHLSGTLSICPWKKSLCVCWPQSLDGGSPIVGDPQGILDQQLRPHPIHLLNIFIISVVTLLYIIELINLKQRGPPQPKLE